MGPLLLAAAKLSGCEQAQRSSVSVCACVPVCMCVCASCMHPVWVGLMNIYASVVLSMKEKQDEDVVRNDLLTFTDLCLLFLI